MDHQHTSDRTDWVDHGGTVRSMDELHHLVARMGTDVHHMRTGLARAAWGALRGRAWSADPVDGQARPSAEDVLGSLRMRITPAGMTAKEAAMRQSLATLLAALDAVDEATLTVWLARISASDPYRTA
ncbi:MULTISPECIES: hypothetical protein [Streptomyces]|uniref:MarR family transcriptional regulator n=1 Tax=Streptomyces doudnae TaxID=3075536 RepID=A0ABD5EM29_9ACTN|nr:MULTISPECIES: hypothetical protein [unclassified Streptomyces]MDT0435636.1 hypothetical protein [Streptomyces sp. DSM 41981]MYQ62590.1 hypothetical protein [Streptomyces sp. SID4950]SCD40421.1 hypothetical protein GA0115242_104895 [Streptomyces sp. SolWspMP-5a-2]